MGFLDFLFNKEKKKEVKQIESSTFNTNFVNEKEEFNFEESIYGKLQLYATDLFYIKEVLPEKGLKLEEQINILTKLLEVTNNENDSEIKAGFSEFEKVFEESKRMADGEYTLRQLKQQNREMNEIFETAVFIDKAKLDEFISYISKIHEKVNDSDNTSIPLFTNVQRQKFNKMSMESEYRLKMLELLHLLSKGSKSEVSINPFKGLSVTKQRIFSQLLFEDIEKAQKQYSSLADVEEAFNQDGQPFDLIDKMAKDLTNQLAEASMVEDFSIRQLFDSKNKSVDSFNFLKDFVQFKKQLNKFMQNKESVLEKYNAAKERERKELEKEQEKKRIEKERKEKLKSMSNDEICNKIYRIEHDLSAKGNRFVNILDFQKDVAREKGLLDSENSIQRDNLSYYYVEDYQLPNLIQNANKSGVAYIIFPDSQEGEGHFTFIIPTSDRNIVSESLHDYDDFNLNITNVFAEDENLGDYPEIVVKSLKDEFEKSNLEYIEKSLSIREISNKRYNLKTGSIPYVSPNKAILFQEHQSIKKCLQKVYDRLYQEYSSEEYYQKILCYFRVPTTRNIIPILEQFKNHNITAFLEPISDEKHRNGKKRDYVNIYFQREDLDRVKKDIEPVISNPNVGMAPLYWSKPHLGEVIRDNIKWPSDIVLDK